MDFLRRLTALIRKEFLQLIRDNSSILIGAALPIVLILIMAREWERGTLETIFVTPVKIFELLPSKMIPYFCLAMFGFMLRLVAARFLYGVPLHGSFTILLLATILYLLNFGDDNIATGGIFIPK